ncbi:type I restriction-modification system subunit M [Shewanella atlantica]|uniref:site-specific DNA-methyltransferase (adenine-specific) n=1 Tax=Shewanella atlantica TaxID=271099 RepID=A0A3S0I890_9GAMM|nr:class I SAM-dependent DNA methyltransferase [Shewanella atlantica]RTR27021.1 SAM-dependent DNA methyltransferase [Shewanella atlantica]
MNTEQLKQLEKNLWSAADNLRANTDLKSTEYATPVLGLIFLKFADNNYASKEQEINEEFAKFSGTRREKSIDKIAVEKCGFYLPPHARYDYLLKLKESENVAKRIKEAMEDIERYKPELEGVLPKDEYIPLTRTDSTVPAQLLKTFSDIPRDASGDILGKIYEYFLGNFALAEGQGGGAFFTPTSVVKLMVEVIEPYKGTVLDPACGSGGMFVQSQQFIENHRAELEELGEDHDENQLFVYGQEKTGDTVKLAKMNIAVNGLRGDVRQANTYSEDPYDSFGKFDFVMANPPFNVDDVPVATVEADARFNTYGIPRNKTKKKKGDEGKETVPNGNYLWINLFATSLKEKGRAALVMANSASDARHSEAGIRETLIKENLIYGMLTLPPNMFYTVTLPATLWFFDKNKQDDKLLFIDARNIYTQIDRAHREFNEEQIQNIALISKLHKGNRLAFIRTIDSYFEKGVELLEENYNQIQPVSEQLIEVLDDKQGKSAVGDLVSEWKALTKLKKSFANYLKETNGKLTKKADIKTLNIAQHKLREVFDPFFTSLHLGLKQLDKIVRKHEKAKVDVSKVSGKRTTTDKETKKLKQALELLHKEVKNAEQYFKHIHWLQDRFPNAQYEDVTGLCKLASQEEVAEQDYSLNPSRYVGVVIEEDGRTEEEFTECLNKYNDELTALAIEAEALQTLISKNLSALVGDDEKI